MHTNDQFDPFKKYLSDELAQTIFNYLEDKDLQNLKFVNKRFYILKKHQSLFRAAINVIELVAKSYVIQDGNQNYLVSEKLTFKWPFENKSYFHSEIVTKIMRGFSPAEIVKFLIEYKFPLNFQNPTVGLSLLHLMIYDLEATKQLIRHGVNLNAKDKYGNTALHYYIKQFATELRPQQLKYGYTMVNQVCRKDNELSAQYVELFAANNFNFEEKDANNKSVFDYIVDRINLNGLNEPSRDKLLLFIALPNKEIFKALENEIVVKPYVFEILSNLLPELTDKLLETLDNNRKKRNINVNTYENEDRGYENLLIADFVKYFMRRTSPEKLLDTMVARLREAFIKGCIPGLGNVEELYQEIHYSIPPHSHCQTVAKLLESLSVNQPLYHKQSLLHYFVHLGDLDCVTYLIERGADVNLQDAYKKTPLDSAIEHSCLTYDEEHGVKFLKLIELFEKNGFKFNVNRNGKPPCHEVLWRCAHNQTLSDSMRKAIVKLLTLTYQHPLEELLKYKFADQRVKVELIERLQSANLNLLPPNDPQILGKRHRFSFAGDSEAKRQKLSEDKESSNDLPSPT